MPQGTVKWFNEEKGYGFITPNDGSEDLFVRHARKVGKDASPWRKAQASPTKSPRAERYAGGKRF
jgi:hypothetical protein